MNGGPVMELRQYTVRPGQRNHLVTLFEHVFIESQEAEGIVLPGQFLDLDDPDRFVWLRGFADMPSRRRALAAFYDGPVWRAYRDEANACLIDSDDVLLLRPLRSFELDGLRRPSRDAGSGGRLVAMICPVDAAMISVVASHFRRRVQPWLAGHGMRVLATYASEPTANDYPRLPVREGEPVFVWFGAFERPTEISCWTRLLGTMPEALPFRAWLQQLQGPSQILPLAPTPRSLLRGSDIDRRALRPHAPPKEPA